MGTEPSSQRKLHRILVAAAISLPVALAPAMSSAEGLLDFLFGGNPKQRPQSSFFETVFNTNLKSTSPVDESPGPGIGSGPSFCVRSCDGKYFPLMRGTASPIRICEAFCPASATEAFFGSSIDTATSENGRRYADSENAFAYRKALRADCTCNGRTPAGLAAIDLTLDDTLRKGDVVATTDGFVAFTGIGLNDPIPEFKPVSSLPGLASQPRARLNDIKVAPTRADMAANDAPSVTRTAPATTIASKPVNARGTRASADALPVSASRQ